MHLRRRLANVANVAATLLLVVLAPSAMAVVPKAKPKLKPRSAPDRKVVSTRKAPTDTKQAVPPRVTAPSTLAVTTAPLSTAASTTAGPTTLPLVTGSISVFAATSLTAALTDIAAAFELANPGAKVAINFGGSSTLVAQIINAAPADVFASADVANMDRLVSAKLIDGSPAIFTRNRLMIVVPKGNPLRVNSLADLARSEVFVALGAVGVPAGDYAREILARAHVTVTPKSLEPNVAAIVSKNVLREIDAGIVYVTDVAINNYRVEGVAIPDDQNIIATYPIAALASSRARSTANAFVAFTQSGAAQAVLAKYKFLPLK